MIYFDNAATTLQKPAEVADAVRYAMSHASSAGRSAHAPAILAADILFDTRALAAEFFDLDDASAVAFTANATQALNTAIFAVAEHCKTMAITGMEHNAVFRPMTKLAQQGKRLIRLDTPLWKPERFLESLEQACRNGLDCLIVNHVSNVYGYRLPIEEIDGILRQYGTAMIVDASQSAGICSLSVRRLRSAAAVCMPGHKGLYGPQGTGILLALTKEINQPLLYGGTGSQSEQAHMPEELPDRFEAGTHNIAGIAGLFEGIRFIQKIGVETVLQHEQELRGQLVRLLEKIPEVNCIASDKNSLQTGVLSVTCETMPAEELAKQLADYGICVRAGLHCAPLAHQTGGTFETGTVRFSPGWFQNMHQVRKIADAMQEIVEKSKKVGDNSG